MSTAKILGWTVPIAGGNYFRQFPTSVVRKLVDRWVRSVPAPFVMYFHVWELDPDQPRIDAGNWHQKIRHYRNLDKMQSILEYYFEKYCFCGIADYLGLETSLGDQESARRQLASENGRRRIPHSGREVARSVLTTANDTSESSTTAVTVVVPCYDEELILPYLANTLNSVQKELSDRYEMSFVFVDDASTDRTWDSLRQTFGEWASCKFVRHEHNQGVAGAVLTGVRNADSETVCSIDCDCTYDPHELRSMIPLLTDDVDLVTASPYHPQGRVKNVPGWRLSLSKTSSFLYRRVLRQKLYTYTSCFRVYRKSAVENLELRATNYLGVAEILAKMDLGGSRIIEYPTTLEVRIFGRSKMKIVRTIAGHLRLMACLLWQRLRGKSSRALNAKSRDRARTVRTVLLGLFLSMPIASEIFDSFPGRDV